MNIHGYTMTSVKLNNCHSVIAPSKTKEIYEKKDIKFHLRKLSEIKLKLNKKKIIIFIFLV